MPAKKSALDLPTPNLKELAGSNVDQAATYMRRLIFAGILAPSAKVPQEQVASALGMTRIPVKEALHILELEGRVRIVPRRGAYVNAVTEQSARDANELIALLFRFAAEKALERMTPDVIGDLTRANQRVQRTTNLVELHHAFDDFQEVIVRAGVDNRLASFMARLRHLSPDTIYEHDPAIANIVRRTARSTLAAFKDGNLDKMDAIMQKTHEEILRRVVPLLISEGLMEA